MKKLCLVLAFLICFSPILSGCNKTATENGKDSQATGTDLPTESPTEAPTTGRPDVPPDIPAPSVYSGTPDTSWYKEGQTEFILTTADQFVGFHELRSKTFDYAGITVKLDCDVVINQGSLDEIKARGEQNHQWKQLNSSYSFKGVFDGQGHTISGVYLQLTASGVKSMFGSAAGNAVFKDFSLINSYFGTANKAEGKAAMAALVAKVSEDNANVTFSNINVTADMEEVQYPFDKVAGFVGTVSGIVSVTLENCSFSGKISITGTHAAGMIAQVSGTDAKISLTSCTNNADITTAQYCGGMIGQCKTSNVVAKDCINKGTLNCPLNVGPLYGEHLEIVGTDPYNGARPEAPAGTTALRVMSFNIQTTLPTSGGSLSAAALNRIEAVRQEILYYSPDLLGVQEDHMTWLTVLNLKDYNVIQDPDAAKSNDNERCAIFYKKGLKFLEGGTVVLTDGHSLDKAGLTYKELTDPSSQYYMTPEELTQLGITSDDDLTNQKTTYWNEKTNSFVTMDSGYYRIIQSGKKGTYGVFDINGQTVIYVNVHLHARNQNNIYSNTAFQKIRSLERVKEWNILNEKLDEIKKNYNDPLVFFTGDFNDHEGTQIYNVICDDFGYLSAEEVTPEQIGPEGSWNNAFNVDEQGDSYPKNAGKEGTTGSYLDYCFVQKGIDVLRFTVGAGKAEITATDGSKKVIYTSDHLPIVTDLCFKTEKTGSPIDPNYKDPNDTTDPTIYTGVADTSWYTGDKTEYILTTADQLVGFNTLRAQKITFEGVTIKLACDAIINEGTLEEIVARGTKKNIAWQGLHSKSFFMGTFDGQGHTISGVYMQLTNSAYKGMFGSLSGNAVIKNLNLENCYFGGPTIDKTILGCLSPRITDGGNVTLSNIHIRKALMSEGDGKLTNIGGFVGIVESGCTLTLENCSFEGDIKFGTKGSQVGGFVGQADGNVILNGCHFGGSIEAVAAAGATVGAQASYAKVTETDCTSTGEVKVPKEG
ncbi:MAG: hypothetical protein IJX19_02275 [Clostridia bacterium]|nr:hypothetical protein [Clostridia bacterium]